MTTEVGYDGKSHLMSYTRDELLSTYRSKIGSVIIETLTSQIKADSTFDARHDKFHNLTIKQLGIYNICKFTQIQIKPFTDCCSGDCPRPVAQCYMMQLKKTKMVSFLHIHGAKQNSRSLVEVTVPKRKIG